jgi:hypothetical protein
MMKGMRLYFLLLLFLLHGPGSHAQNPFFSGDTITFVENTMKKFDKNVKFTILPGPAYNATQRLGIMILPVLVYNLNVKDSLSPPSSTALGFYFDFHGSWMVVTRQNFYWNQNKWRATFGCGYGQLKLKFFGIGRDTAVVSNSESNYVWTRLDGFFASATCYRKVVSKFFAGLEYNYSGSDYTGEDSLAEASMRKEGIEPGYYTESILAPAFVWDSRDNIFWSLKGYYAGLNFHYANSLLFSSFDYSSLAGFVSGYYSLLKNSHKLSLAWNFNFQKGWGEVPYTRMASFGRGDNTTGYTRGKYVNRAEVAGQAEIRYDIRNFIAVGGYAGTGKVFPTLETFGQSVWLWFGGTRIYLNVMPSRNLRFRLDLAVGRKDYGVYIGIGQGF